jgi:hypothetical protein
MEKKKSILEDQNSMMAKIQEDNLISYPEKLEGISQQEDKLNKESIVQFVKFLKGQSNKLMQLYDIS